MFEILETVVVLHYFNYYSVYSFILLKSDILSGKAYNVLVEVVY